MDSETADIFTLPDNTMADIDIQDNYIESQPTPLEFDAYQSTIGLDDPVEYGDFESPTTSNDRAATFPTTRTATATSDRAATFPTTRTATATSDRPTTFPTTRTATATSDRTATFPTTRTAMTDRTTTFPTTRIATATTDRMSNFPTARTDTATTDRMSTFPTARTDTATTDRMSTFSTASADTATTDRMSTFPTARSVTTSAPPATTFSRLYNKHITKKDPKVLFDQALLISKFILLITLLIFAFTNKNVEFISTNPRAFLDSGALVGGTAALASAIIAGSRFASVSTILNAALVTFLLFFVIHLLMELSGLYGQMPVNESTLTDAQKAQRAETAKNIQITTGITGSIVAIVALAMIPICWRVGGFKNLKANRWQYLLELFAFSVLTAIPTMNIHTKHGGTIRSATVRTLLMAGGFGGLYIGLQAGGFFNEMFGNIPLFLDSRVYPVVKKLNN
jgi:hypothetical protein